MGRGHKVTLAYGIFLSHLLRVTPCEAKEWESLGVNLTDESEERLADLPGAIEFMEQAI